MLAPNPPFWFRMRQGKSEPAGTDTYRLTGPNLPDAYISVKQTPEGFFQPVVKLGQDGQDVAEFQGAIHSEPDAWQAAFEIYRQRFVV